MSALRLANGRFVPKAVAEQLRSAAAGVSDDELQRLIKEHGVEGAFRELAKPRVEKRFISKKKPFGRVVRSQFADDGDMGRVRYLHATKGWRTRRLTPHLHREMSWTS